MKVMRKKDVKYIQKKIVTCGFFSVQNTLKHNLKLKTRTTDRAEYSNWNAMSVLWNMSDKLDAYLKSASKNTSRTLEIMVKIQNTHNMYLTPDMRIIRLTKLCKVYISRMKDSDWTLFERSEIYELTKNGMQLNDTHTVTRNPNFQIIIDTSPTASVV
jgi:hypothetical protein